MCTVEVRTQWSQTFLNKTYYNLILHRRGHIWPMVQSCSGLNLKWIQKRSLQVVAHNTALWWQSRIMVGHERQNFYSLQPLQSILPFSLKVIKFFPCTSLWPAAGQEINWFGFLGDPSSSLKFFKCGSHTPNSEVMKDQNPHKWNTQWKKDLRKLWHKKGTGWH